MGHFLRSCKNSLLIWLKEKLSSFRNWLPIICLCLQQELHRCLSLVLTVPSIHFVHDESKSVPSASTCSNTLYLYVNETTIHNPIRRYLVTALMNGATSSVKSECVISMTMCNSGTLIMCWYKIFCVERTFFTVLWFPCYDYNFAKVDSGIDIVDKDLLPFSRCYYF